MLSLAKAYGRSPAESWMRSTFSAELVIRAVTRNPATFRYGRWRVWGDLARSRYFDVAAGPRVEPLIKALGIKASASRLGQSFQGHAAVRPMSESSHRMLAHYARELPVLKSVSLYPEDEFEARLVHGEQARDLVLKESPSSQNQRIRYLYESVDVQRLRRNVLELQDIYGGKCQVCLYDPKARYGHRTCHGHHIEWLSRGGEDSLDNMVLICPNHHSAIHRDDAVFDYADFTFAFRNGVREPLTVNWHLPAA